MTMQVGQTLTIGGWVKTGREAGGGKWVFLEVNDGTTFLSLQVQQLSLRKRHKGVLAGVPAVADFCRPFRHSFRVHEALWGCVCACSGAAGGCLYRRQVWQPRL